MPIASLDDGTCYFTYECIYTCQSKSTLQDMIENRKQAWNLSHEQYVQAFLHQAGS